MKLKLFSNSSKAHLGLEFSPEGIVILELKKSKASFSLENLSKRLFECDGVVQGGQIINPAVFIKTLSSMIIDDGISVKNINVSVPSSIAFIKTLTFPDLPLHELSFIARQEAVNHIPFPLEEVNIAVDIIESSRRTDKDGNKIDVVLVALPKSISANIIDTLSKVGLKVESIEISAFSAIRTLANSGFIDSSGLLDVSVLIGYENTDINIIQNGMPVFSNNVPVGKKNLIENLVSSLEIDKNEIEKLLPEVALVIPGISIIQEGLAAKASVAAKNVYNSILQEVEKTIEFYQSQLPEPIEVKTIIISGSGVCIQNIDRYFINRLKTFTVLCNSLKNINTSINSTENLIYPTNFPSMVSVAGLALREE